MIDIIDARKEAMATDLLTNGFGSDGWLIMYAADGTLTGHTNGIPDDPSIATDATVLATMQFQNASTPTSNGQIVFTQAGTILDSNANATGVAAWGRFMSNTVYNAGAGDQDAGIMDCSVGTTADGTADILLNSTNIVAGGIVSLTTLSLDFAS